MSSITFKQDNTRNSLDGLLALHHLPMLNGIRAVAAISVLAYHFSSRFEMSLGVSGFFVLSGFLITWLLLQEANETGSVNLKNFYIKRMLRILPAYYAFVGFMIIQEHLRGFGEDWTLSAVLAAFLNVMNYYNAFNGNMTTPIGHVWSLGVEWQFYILWPLLFVMLGARGTGTLAVGVTGIIFVILCWRSVIYFGLGSRSMYYVYNAFDTRADNLLVGCLLAIGLQWQIVRQIAISCALSPVFPLLTLFLLGCSVAFGTAGFHYSIGLTLDAILLAILIIQLLQSCEHRMWRWLEHPIMCYLGVISYAFYLWHGLGLALAKKFEMFPEWGQFTIAFGATTMLASLSYWLIECPFLVVKDHIKHRRPFTFSCLWMSIRRNNNRNSARMSG